VLDKTPERKSVASQIGSVNLRTQAQVPAPTASLRGIGAPYLQPGRLAIVKALQEHYGENQVDWRSNSSIFIFASPSSSSMRLAMVLTVEQAAFLARNPISPDDLVARRYPAGWPTH
jgi:hypothetical protein